MLSIDQRTYKLLKLTSEQREVFDALLMAPGTLVELCKTIGRTECRMEMLLGTLCDLGLAIRSNGSRTYAVFRAA